MIILQIEKKFSEYFPGQPVIITSHGRINIIGEHTDYTNGYVLPAAIVKAISVAVNKRDDGIIKIYSTQCNELYKSSVVSSCNKLTIHHKQINIIHCA